MRLKTLVVILLFSTVLGGFVYERFQEIKKLSTKKPNTASRVVPVDVADIEHGQITLRRNFTGTLEAREEFIVSPKIEGRIVHLQVDIGDNVSRNMIVATLDNAEYLQTVTQVEADLAVAKANLAEAQSLLIIAKRELKRIEKLSESGFNSVSQQDTSIANQLAKQAHVQVTGAQVTRAEAELEVAKIHLSYTQIHATWQGGNDTRVVAERLVSEGETVSAKTPLLRIIEFTPITAVFFVTEKDYGLLKVTQHVELSTDVYSDEIFTGQISRIAPVFRKETRQARVEVSIDNADLRLKPGMFIRAHVELDSVMDASIVPEQAIASRNHKKGVFLVSADNKIVTWHPVKIGIREHRKIQLKGEQLYGRVVILGQQLLEDGSHISMSQQLLEKEDPLKKRSMNKGLIK